MTGAFLSHFLLTVKETLVSLISHREEGVCSRCFFPPSSSISWLCLLPPKANLLCDAFERRLTRAGLSWAKSYTCKRTYGHSSLSHCLRFILALLWCGFIFSPMFFFSVFIQYFTVWHQQFVVCVWRNGRNEDWDTGRRLSTEPGKIAQSTNITHIYTYKLHWESVSVQVRLQRWLVCLFRSYLRPALLKQE